MGSRYISLYGNHYSVPQYHIHVSYRGFRACALDVDPCHIYPLQTPITWVYGRHSSYHSCNIHNHRLYLCPIVPMAMVYTDHFSSVVLCNSRYWIYCFWSESYRDIVDYLHCGGTLEHRVVLSAISSRDVIYNRLLYWSYHVCSGLSAGDKEKLYLAVSKDCHTPALCNYYGSPQGPIHNNHMGTASCFHGHTMPGTAIFRILRTHWLHVHCQHTADAFRPTMRRCFHVDYYHVVLQQTFCWGSLSLYFNCTYHVSIVVSRCNLGNYIGTGIFRALSSYFRRYQDARRRLLLISLL